MAKRADKIIVNGLNRVHDLAARFHQPPEERRFRDRNRPQHSARSTALAGEANDVATDVEVGQHDVRRVGVVADRPENRVCDLALVGRARHAHLEDMQRLQTRPLRLRLRKVIGVGKGEADVRGHVLEQLHVPVVEGPLAIRLQREHGGDAIAAQHRHPDE